MPQIRALHIIQHPFHRKSRKNCFTKLILSIPHAAPDGKRSVPPHRVVKDFSKPGHTKAGGERDEAKGPRLPTYNIQPTTDTENLFPLIGPEMPERWRHMSLGKDDLDSLG